MSGSESGRAPLNQARISRNRLNQATIPSSSSTASTTESPMKSRQPSSPRASVAKEVSPNPKGSASAMASSG